MSQAAAEPDAQATSEAVSDGTSECQTEGAGWDPRPSTLKLLGKPLSAEPVNRFAEETKQQLALLQAAKEHLITLAQLRQEFVHDIEGRVEFPEEVRHWLVDSVDGWIRDCGRYIDRFISRTV